MKKTGNEKGRQFRTLVEKSSEVIFLSDENRNRVYVSPTVQNVLGYTVEEFLSVKPEELKRYKTSLGCRQK